MKFALVITLIFSAFAIEAALGDCVEEPVKDNKNVALGGYKSIKIDDEVRDVALKATGLWNSENKTEDYFKVTCIRKAQTKVVAGTLYKINLSIGETECALSDVPVDDELTQENVDECELKNDGQTLSCEFELWQKLDNTAELESAKCQDQTSEESEDNDQDEDVSDDDNEEPEEEESDDDTDVVEGEEEDQDEDDNEDDEDENEDDDDNEDKEENNEDDKETKKKDEDDEDA